MTGCRRWRSYHRAASSEQIADACYNTARPARRSSHADPITYLDEHHWFPDGAFNPSREQLVRWRERTRKPQVSQSEVQELGDSEGKYFEANMARLGEPSLMKPLADVIEAYRFTWFRAFLPPIAVRVARTATGAFLIVREAKGDEEHPSQDSDDKEVRMLSAQQWTCLELLVQAAQFWKLPTVEGGPSPDGQEWLFEGAKGSKYHVVNRWDPLGRKSLVKYTRLAWYLMRLGGVKRNPVHVNSPAEETVRAIQRAAAIHETQETVGLRPYR